MSVLSLLWHDSSGRYSRSISEYWSPVGKTSKDGEVLQRLKLEEGDSVGMDPERRFGEEVMERVENESTLLVVKEAFDVSGTQGLS